MSLLVSSLNTYIRSHAKGATAVMFTLRKRGPRTLTVGLPLVPEPEVETAQITKAAAASTTTQARMTLGRRALGRVNVVAGAETRRHRRGLGVVGGLQGPLHARVGR